MLCYIITGRVALVSRNLGNFRARDAKASQNIWNKKMNRKSLNMLYAPLLALPAFFALSALVVFPAPATAEEATEASPEIEEVVVSAHPLSAEGLAHPVSVVSGEKLRRGTATSLGETLNQIPGIHSSSFGQAVGRPVIRGLGGPRVKTMDCLLYTSPSPRDREKSRMPSSA